METTLVVSLMLSTFSVHTNACLLVPYPPTRARSRITKSLVFHWGSENIIPVFCLKLVMSFVHQSQFVRIFKLLSSSLYSQSFGRYVLWPSSGVSHRTQEPTQNIYSINGGGLCDTIDAGVVEYRLSYMYVHMCRHMSSCECTYVCMYRSAGVYICVWLWVDQRYVYFVREPLIQSDYIYFISATSRWKCQAGGPWVRSRVAPVIIKVSYEIGCRRNIKINNWIPTNIKQVTKKFDRQDNW